MNDSRRQILDMLAQGKINSDEAERLIAALERNGTPVARDTVKYLRVLVDANDEQEGPTKVNVRVPMQLLRAGVRLTGVIPDRAREQVNEALPPGVEHHQRLALLDALDDGQGGCGGGHGYSSSVHLGGPKRGTLGLLMVFCGMTSSSQPRTPSTSIGSPAA